MLGLLFDIIPLVNTPNRLHRSSNKAKQKKKIFFVLNQVRVYFNIKTVKKNTNYLKGPVSLIQELAVK